jgi:hypothetical protein
MPRKLQINWMTRGLIRKVRLMRKQNYHLTAWDIMKR